MKQPCPRCKGPNAMYEEVVIGRKCVYCGHVEYPQSLTRYQRLRLEYQMRLLAER